MKKVSTYLKNLRMPVVVGLLYVAVIALLPASVAVFVYGVVKFIAILSRDIQYGEYWNTGFIAIFMIFILLMTILTYAISVPCFYILVYTMTGNKERLYYHASHLVAIYGRTMHKSADGSYYLSRW